MRERENWGKDLIMNDQKGNDQKREWPKKGEIKTKEENESLAPPHNHLESFSFDRIGSHAFVFTHNWGSLSPSPVVVFCLLISRLSRISRFCWRALLFLSLKVAKIFGSSQSTEPELHWRTCFEIPEMFSSGFDDVTSLWCWLIRVLKLTRVCPMYFASWLHEQVCW